MSALLISAVIATDPSGRPCAEEPISQRELLNAVDSLQRHLSPMGIRVSLSTRRVPLGDNDAAPKRDEVFFNGKELAGLAAGSSLNEGIDSAILVRAGLEAAELQD